MLVKSKSPCENVTYCVSRARFTFAGKGLTLVGLTISTVMEILSRIL
jgi:hypothetical protein